MAPVTVMSTVPATIRDAATDPHLIAATVITVAFFAALFTVVITVHKKRLRLL